MPFPRTLWHVKRIRQDVSEESLFHVAGGMLLKGLTDSSMSSCPLRTKADNLSVLPASRLFRDLVEELWHLSMQLEADVMLFKRENAVVVADVGIHIRCSSDAVTLESSSRVSTFTWYCRLFIIIYIYDI